MTRDRRLLVISSLYPFGQSYSGTFVKGQVDHLSKEFEKVLVLCPLSFLPNAITRVPLISSLLHYSGQPLDYSYSNITVRYPRYLPLPPRGDSFAKMRLPLVRGAVERDLRHSKISADLIHSHFVLPPGYVGAEMKRKFGIPLIVTAHGGDVYDWPFRSEWWMNKTRSALDSADRIITTSRRNCEVLTERIGIPRSKIHVIGNGFDPNSFFPSNQSAARDLLGLPKNAKTILSVGNLVTVKGHRYLIEAVGKLSQSHSRIYCIILGRGELREELSRTVASLKLLDKVRIVDGTLHSQIPFWMNACDLFVLPSLDEGQPTVLVEALGCGKPVIASRVGGIPEILGDDRLGVLVNEADPAELADAIAGALNVQWDAELISRYARDGFAYARISREIMEVYRRVLD